jgi:putative tryptophan/tyrosine transport system substrate-binding protein
VKRRDALLVLVAATLPSEVAHSQTGRVPRVAFVGTTTAAAEYRIPQLAAALRQHGYIDGQNIRMDWRFAENDHTRLRTIAEELARSSPDVMIVTTAGVATIFRKATDRLPIVVWSAGDLEGTGLVESLKRPGGNITGVQILSPDLMTKRLELLRALVPSLTRVGFVKPITPAGFITDRYLEVTEDAARALGIELHSFEAHSASDFDSVFLLMVSKGVQAALVISNPLSFDHRSELARAAAVARLPTMLENREFVAAGGLISYGAVRHDFARLVAGYVHQIINGASPADLPIQQATNFEIVINLKTAAALGLSIPPTLIARADEVIE